MDTEYINGVYDDEGNELIRPLNYEEKTFLNTFYEEVVGANFIHDAELRRFKREMEKIKEKEELTDQDAQQLMHLQLMYCQRADEVLIYTDQEDQNALYGENNARNRCIFNIHKTTGFMEELSEESFDEIHANVYSDPENSERLILSRARLDGIIIPEKERKVNEKPKTKLRKKELKE